MPKWETIKAGDTLWDVHREAMGNTTMSKWGSWRVEVISINHAEGWAMVRWNYNRPEKRYRRQMEKYQRSPKKVKGVCSSCGGTDCRCNRTTTKGVP